MATKIILGVWPNLSVEVTGDGAAVFQELAFWDEIPHTCPVRISKEEECGGALRFTFRKPTAKQGAKKGQTFEYAGLECDGDPSHECQFSKRLDQSGFFIRKNRQDGKPNWRLAYNRNHDDEPEYDDDEQPQSSQPATAQGSGNIGQPGFLTQNQYNELMRVASTKVMGESQMNEESQRIYAKHANQLTATEAIQFRQTLAVL